jgi:hypothetical protein
MFFVFDMTSLIGTGDKASATLTLLLAYGASAVPLSFIYSLGFKDHATTIVALSLVNFVTGFVLAGLDTTFTTDVIFAVDTPFHYVILQLKTNKEGFHYVET